MVACAFNPLSVSRVGRRRSAAAVGTRKSAQADHSGNPVATESSSGGGVHRTSLSLDAARTAGVLSSVVLSLRRVAVRIASPIVLVALAASCSRDTPRPDPPSLPEAVNLLDSVLEDGVPAELRKSCSPPESYAASIDDNVYVGQKSLLIEGAGEYCAVNLPPVKLEGRRIYIATVYISVTQGEAALKLNYLRDRKRLGDTTSVVANSQRGGWQQLTVLSQRSRFPQATHLSVTAVCRGEANVRFDEFSLTSQ